MPYGIKCAPSVKAGLCAAADSTPRTAARNDHALDVGRVLDVLIVDGGDLFTGLQALVGSVGVRVDVGDLDAVAVIGRGHAAATVDPVIEKLSGKRLVSDDRYVASFVHHHARRGQGPVRIRAELRQQGIPDERIDQELQACGTDWRQLASEVRRRKFKSALPRSAAERAKQARFLQYRGFDADQIRAALSFDPHGDDMEVDTQLTDEAADPEAP